MLLGRPLKDLRWLLVMFIVCAPIIALTYSAGQYASARLQITVLIIGTIAAAAVWYFFGEVIVEGATRIYRSLRDQDRPREDEIYDSFRHKDTKYCISCGTEIPRRARFCRECRAEQ